MSAKHAAIAVTRFGLGAAPGEIQTATSDPRGYLLRQLTAPPPPFEPDLMTTAQAAKAFQDYRIAAGEDRSANRPSPDGAAMAMTQSSMTAAPAIAPADIPAARQALMRATLHRDIAERTRIAAISPAGFRERLVRFWFNHFTVSAQRPQVAPLVGPYEREVIRPGLDGSFTDLLLAALSHPAMLLYLDQAGSVGPNSVAGRRRGLGLNENLAREALELHTLGVDGGYTQDDVEELAKALTGWTITRGAGRGRGAAARDPVGEFVFERFMHEPGARTIVGARYAEAGVDQARAVLTDLARHPATARHIATKLATHFIADIPPEAAIDALALVFLDTQGDLASLHQTLVALDAAWSSPGSKFKTPEEFLISSIRATQTHTSLLTPRGLRTAFAALGQVPYTAPSPAGWPDDTSSWAGPDAVLKRLEWANAVARRAGSMEPDRFVTQALGPLASDHTRHSLARAGDPAQALTLALMSPEFQRR